MIININDVEAIESITLKILYRMLSIQNTFSRLVSYRRTINNLYDSPYIIIIIVCERNYVELTLNNLISYKLYNK